MQPGISVRVKVFVVIAVTLIMAWTSVARADHHKRIVIFLEGTPLLVQQLIVKLSGSTVVHTLSLINALAIELPLEELLDALAFLLGDPAVVGVFDDPIGVLDPIAALSQVAAPADESYNWGLVRIGVPVVHEHMPEWQGTGVTIAILDTGIDGSHPDLEQNVTRGFNARPGGGSSADDNGHGTHMAGIIAAAVNNRGLVGVAPRATLVPVKVLDHNGTCNLSDFIKGLEYVYAQRIKLVNMSLGFPADSLPMELAIRRLYNSGVIMVASAGNRPTSGATTGVGGGSEEGGGSEGEGATSTCDTSTNGGGSEEGGGSEGEGTASTCTDSSLAIRYPARYPWVIAVAAADVYDQITDYSLAGPQMDVAAPGGAQASERILSTRRGGGYNEGSGTSQAAAHVTGGLALALQRQSRLTFAEARNLLLATAWDLGYDRARQGAGLIDVEKMMETLQ